MNRSRNEVTFLDTKDEGLGKGVPQWGFHIFSVAHIVYGRANDVSTRDESREHCVLDALVSVIQGIYQSIIEHNLLFS